MLHESESERETTVEETVSFSQPDFGRTDASLTCLDQTVHRKSTRA